MTQALYFIVKTLAQLYLLLLLLRFWLPVLRADFRNPIAQGILRITAPVVIPVRRFIPPIGRLDTSTIFVAFVFEFLLVLALISLRGLRFDALPIAVTSMFELAISSLNLFFFVILLKIILSWVAPHTYNPMTALLNTLAEPLLRPFRRIVPAVGGFDVSPIFTIVLLKAAEIILQSYRPIPVWSARELPPWLGQVIPDA
jgi:YggT family protein